MHAINYEAPKTLKDAVALLAQHGEKGRPLCGGTDLIIQLRAGVRRPEFVVDVKKIPDLLQDQLRRQEGVAARRRGPVHRGLRKRGNAQALPRPDRGGASDRIAADPEPRLGRRQSVQRLAGRRHHAGADRARRARRASSGPRASARSRSRISAPRRAAPCSKPGELLVEILIPAPKPHTRGRLPALHPAQRDGYRGGRRRRVGCTLDGDKVKRGADRLGAVAADAAVRGQGGRIADRQEARRRDASSRARKLAIEAQHADRRHARHGRVPPPSWSAC